MTEQQPRIEPPRLPMETPGGGTTALLITVGALVAFAGLSSILYGIIYSAQGAFLLNEEAYKEITNETGLEASWLKSRIVRGIITMLVIYLVVGGFYLWAGILACMARRWSVKLLQAWGWVSVVGGVLGLISVFYAIFSNYDDFGVGFGLGSFVMITLLMALQPLAIIAGGIFLVLVLGLRNIRVLLAVKNPQPDWTSAHSLPKLSWIVALALGTLYSLAWLIALGDFVIVFDQPITGLKAWIINSSILLTLTLATWLAIRGNSLAWWMSLALVFFLTVSITYSVYSVDPLNCLEAFLGTEQKITIEARAEVEKDPEAYQTALNFIRPLWAIPSIWGLSLLGLLFWIQFAPPASPQIERPAG